MCARRNHETGCFSLAEREIGVLLVFASKSPRGCWPAPPGALRRTANVEPGGCRNHENSVDLESTGRKPKCQQSV